MSIVLAIYSGKINRQKLYKVVLSKVIEDSWFVNFCNISYYELAHILIDGIAGQVMSFLRIGTAGEAMPFFQ